MADEEYTEPTSADEREVTSLEALGDTRSTAESERLQDLYINRGVWRDIQRAIARAGEVAKAVVVQPFKAISGTSRDWTKRKRGPADPSKTSKGSPLLIIPIIPSTKWSLVSAVSSATMLIAMEFTPSELTAIGMVIGLLTSLLASITSIVIARQGKAAAVDAKVAIAENTKLTEKTSADVETVKKDVDGMKSKDAARIAELEREALALKQANAELKQTAVLLAQSQAPHTVVIASPAAPMAPAVAGSAAEETLQQIDQTTARTEVKVDDLKGKS